MLQWEGREVIGLGPFFCLYFQFWGYLQYQENSLFGKGFMANLRWQTVLFNL